MVKTGHDWLLVHFSHMFSLVCGMLLYPDATYSNARNTQSGRLNPYCGSTTTEMPGPTGVSGNTV
jgi:hypothetical protein